MTAFSDLAAKYWFLGGTVASLMWFAAGRQSLSNKRPDAAIGWQAIAVIIALIVLWPLDCRTPMGGSFDRDCHGVVGSTLYQTLDVARPTSMSVIGIFRQRRSKLCQFPSSYHPSSSAAP